MALQDEIQRTPINVRVLSKDGNGYADLEAVGEAKGNKTFAAVSVTNAATPLLAANASRKSATIYNNGSQTVYLGKDGTLTAANGLPLPAGASGVDKDSSDAWYGIVASGSADVRTEEVA